MSLVLPPDLTIAQTGVWLDQQLFPGRPICNTGQALTIRGPLRFDLFETALRGTVAESSGLRLPPRSAPPNFELPLLDFRGEPNPLAAANQWMRSEMRAAIPLQDSALFRFALIRIGDENTIWFQKYHHIIIDATGRRLLSARVACRYRAARFGDLLPELGGAMPEDLLNADRRYAVSSRHEADRAYWLERFTRRPGPLVEISRGNTERANTGCHARIAFTLRRTDFARLETAARGLGQSAFRAIVALMYAAFARLYDRSDIVLGIELGNRSGAGAKQAIGMLSQPLPLPLTSDRATTIAEVARQVDAALARDYQHRRFPMQELVAALGLTRQGRHGLFDVIVNYIPTVYDFAFEQLLVEVTNLSYGFSAPWMVTIADTGATRDLDVAIDTDPGLISDDMATHLAECVETLLQRGLEDVDCPLARLPIMSDATMQRLQGFSSGETVAAPAGATLATLFAATAERTPEAVALIWGDQEFSFAALRARANHLARRLAALGVRPGVVVGIALPRTEALVVAVLAVHQAGGAYLALDPSYPAERIRFIVADSAAPVILTNAALAPTFADSGARLAFDAEAADVETEAVEFTPARPDDLAYVLYTSGSTGRPKAVGIEHRNLINLIYWGRSILSDAELGGMLFSTSLNFDLSAFEMFLPLCLGGCLVMVENLLALHAAPRRDRARFLNTGPSLLDALLRIGNPPPGVTSVLVAGERLSRHMAGVLFDAAPGIRLLNCYGPTETTVYSTGALVDPSERSEPSIGGAIWNTSLHVLDSGGALLPPGAEGELFIGGAGVARGYLGRPELTAERFLPNPHGPGRIYRTGDRVRWRPNGALEFVGRADDQIKINGVRVEPGEIEAALLALPGIAAAAVALHEDGAGARRLAAYLVSTAGAARDAAGARAALERRLPRHMIPSWYVWLDAMPMTPNGKLDRKALPAPPHEDAAAVADRPPETSLEREIASLWEDVLRQPPLGVQADFYDSGGDSLALLGLFAAIETRFGRRLTVDVLAGGLTIAGLATLLAGDEQSPAPMDPVVALQPLGDLLPFFCVHGIGGGVLHLHRLAIRMGTKRPFLGLRRITESSVAESVAEMSARYVAAVLARQPEGPFYLGGHSFGAMVAYEMARQMTEQGHEIGLLAIIDARTPEWRPTARDAIPALVRLLANLPGRFRLELGKFETSSRFREGGRSYAGGCERRLAGSRTPRRCSASTDSGRIRF